MLIILDGPDCAGKTTLADQIERYIRAKFPNDTVDRLHAGPPKSHPLDEYVVPLLSYHPRVGHHVICDRWHIGEYIYPKLYGRRTQLNVGVQTYIEMFLASRGAVTFILAPDGRVLTARLATRGDDVANEMTMIAAWDHFRCVDKLYDVDVRVVETATPDDIVSLAQGHELRAMTHLRFNTYVGSPVPETLILGDVRNCMGGLQCPHKIPHPKHGTALMPYPSTSGAYLWSASGLHRDWAVANACDTDSAWAMWNLLGKPNVVALGQKAAKRLDDLKIPFAAVPHPQFIRRFHYASGTEYVNLINEVCGSERKELEWRPSSKASQASRSTQRSSVAS